MPRLTGALLDEVRHLMSLVAKGDRIVRLYHEVEWFDVEDGNKPSMRLTDEVGLNPADDEWALPWFAVQIDGEDAWIANDGQALPATGVFVLDADAFPVKRRTVEQRPAAPEWGPWGPEGRPES